MPSPSAINSETGIVTAVILAALLLIFHHKRQALSGYLWALAAEFLSASGERRVAIRRQTALATRRMDYIAKGQRYLYAAALCFLWISLVPFAFLVFGFSSAWRTLVFYCTFAPFLAGTLLIGAAVILELKEHALADSALRSEIPDVTDPPPPASKT